MNGIRQEQKRFEEVLSLFINGRYTASSLLFLKYDKPGLFLFIFVFFTRQIQHKFDL